MLLSHLETIKIFTFKDSLRLSCFFHFWGFELTFHFGWCTAVISLLGKKTGDDHFYSFLWFILFNIMGETPPPKGRSDNFNNFTKMPWFSRNAFIK